MVSRASSWRKCEHPRTPENTCGVRATKPGGNCRQCQYAAQARYSRTEKFKAVQAKYRATDKGRAMAERSWRKRGASERGRATQARLGWSRRGHVGATWEKFCALVKRQRGRCAICRGVPNGNGRLHWDHDHATGATRGALCFCCNRDVGQYERGLRFTDRKLNERIARYLVPHAEVAA